MRRISLSESDTLCIFQSRAVPAVGESEDAGFGRHQVEDQVFSEPSANQGGRVAAETELRECLLDLNELCLGGDFSDGINIECGTDRSGGGIGNQQTCGAAPTKAI